VLASQPAQIELCDCCVDALNDRADHVLDELLAGHVEEAERSVRLSFATSQGRPRALDLLSMIFEETVDSDSRLSTCSARPASSLTRTPTSTIPKPDR